MTPQEIEQIIDMLVEKLGPMGGQVWYAYTRQAYLQGIIVGIGFLLVLALTLTAFGISLWAVTKLKKMGARPQEPASLKRAYDEDEGTYFCTLFGAAISAIAFLIPLLLVANEALRLINPEYYALQMLLGR